MIQAQVRWPLCTSAPLLLCSVHSPPTQVSREPLPCDTRQALSTIYNTKLLNSSPPQCQTSHQEASRPPTRQAGRDLIMEVASNSIYFPLENMQARWIEHES